MQSLWDDERIAQAAQEAADEWVKDVMTCVFAVCKKQLERMRDEHLAAQQYSHRNGEADVPTITGYFWYIGVAGDEQYADLLTVMKYRDADRLVIMGADTKDPEEFKGRWYGPVLPPWQAQRPIEPENT